MEIRYSQLSVIFLLSCVHAHVLSSQNATCSLDDLGALRDLWNGLMIQTSWGTLKPGINLWSISDSNCCSWHGVLCGSFPSSICSGKRVVGLDLDLGNTNLKGRLSVSQVGLELLSSLNVSYNLISGALPARLFKLLNSQVVDLSNNEFSGLFPANIFSGNVPAGFGNCTSLEEHLILNSDKLLGSLPKDLFRLHKSSYLHLQENSLSGALSEAAANLSKLIQLDISLNEFSGALLDAFMNFVELLSFTADSNRFSGWLPYSLSSSPAPQLLNIRNNSLKGPVDINCTAMIQLSSLTHSSNQFHGALPDSPSLCQKLKTLNLAQNPLSGEVPESFKNLKSLSALSLTKTSLQNISTALGVLQ